MKDKSLFLQDGFICSVWLFFSNFSPEEKEDKFFFGKASLFDKLRPAINACFVSQWMNPIKIGEEEHLYPPEWIFYTPGRPEGPAAVGQGRSRLGNKLFSRTIDLLEAECLASCATSVVWSQQRGGGGVLRHTFDLDSVLHCVLHCVLAARPRLKKRASVENIINVPELVRGRPSYSFVAGF